MNGKRARLIRRQAAETFPDWIYETEYANEVRKEGGKELRLPTMRMTKGSRRLAIKIVKRANKNIAAA